MEFSIVLHSDTRARTHTQHTHIHWCVLVCVWWNIWISCFFSFFGENSDIASKQTLMKSAATNIHYINITWNCVTTQRVWIIFTSCLLIKSQYHAYNIALQYANIMPYQTLFTMKYTVHRSRLNITSYLYHSYDMNNFQKSSFNCILRHNYSDCGLSVSQQPKLSFTFFSAKKSFDVSA